MSHEAGAYLTAYDIASPRRLARIHRRLKSSALWVQYSVFVGRFTPAGLGELTLDLRGSMDPRADDIRIYRLPEFARPVLIGDSLWPEGAFFHGLDPRPLQEITAPPMACLPPPGLSPLSPATGVKSPTS